MKRTYLVAAAIIIAVLAVMPFFVVAAGRAADVYISYIDWVGHLTGTRP